MPRVTEHCPKCGPGAVLVVRENAKTGEVFLGCPNFPKCHYTRPMPVDRQMRESHAPTLPGME